MRKVFFLLFVLAFVFYLPCLAYSKTTKGQIVFAVVLDGKDSRFDFDLNGVKKKIKEAAGFSREIVFPDKYIINSEFDLKKTEACAKDLLQNKDIDIILALGPYGSSVFKKISNLQKPVIAVYFIGPENFSPDFKGNLPQKPNLYYIKPYPFVFSAAETFHELVEFSKIEVILDPWVFDLSGKKNKILSSDLSYTLSLLKAENSPLETIEKIDEKTDSVLIAPLFSYSLEEFEVLVKELNKRKIYTFSLSGNEEVKKGCLSGIQNNFFDDSIKRKIGILAEKIISGKNIENSSKVFLKKPELEINMDTADILGVSPNFNIFLEAFLYYGDSKEGKELINLVDIIDFSIENNSLMRAFKQDTIKANLDKKIAKSYILPQAGVMAEGIVRDEDSAYSSLGQYPENEINLKFYIRQTLFDDEVFTSLDQSKKLFLAAMEKEKAKKLETAAKTASGYFKYLSAVKLKEIRRNDLELSKTNLLKAQTNYEIGTKGPGDVFRWESMTADAKKELLRAVKAENQALIKLEKITGRKFDKKSLFVFPRLDSKIFWVDEKTFEKLSKNRASIEQTKKILGKFAIENSPELSAYTKLVQAQEANYKYLKRKHFVPKVYLKGEYLQRVGRSGAGSDGVSFDLPPPMPAFVIDEPKDNSWQIGLEAVLPIFTGLRDKNLALKSDEELTRLQVIRKDILENIEEDISLLVEEAASSYLGIYFAKESKNSATKNLKLVSDAYELGLADSVDLIDAQHSYTGADVMLSASLYDFMEKIYLIQARLGFEDFSDIPDKKEKLIELIRRKP
ncbi:MAG: TolC family protein [Desulforegulaceae bacterium]|nr:TolC family protein [Desulforegulaceae bacterium]